MDWYYDNNFEIHQANPDFVEFERVYCLQFYAFTEKQWGELELIHQQLPGTRYQLDVPHWYGNDENHPPYLWISIEPSGLQVVGILPLNDWVEWDEKFRKQIELTALPTFEI